MIGELRNDEDQDFAMAYSRFLHCVPAVDSLRTDGLLKFVTYSQFDLHHVGRYAMCNGTVIET
jgi:hypothetical protein